MRNILGNLFTTRSARRQSTQRPTKLNRLRRRGLTLSLLEDRCVPATFMVTNNSDGPVAAAGALPGSLRQAVFDANALAGADLIQFSGAMAGQTISIDGTALAMTLTEAVTIQGLTSSPGVPNVTIDALNASRVFIISDATTGTGHLFDISGLLITHGNAAGQYGGGALVITQYDNINLTDVIFDSCSAGAGGGFAAQPSSAPTLVLGTVNVTRCSFTNNTNPGNFGGGFCLEAGTGANLPTTGWTVNIADTTFDSNISGANGGGAFIRFANSPGIKITGSTFSNNSVANGFGGGISFLTAGTGTYTNPVTIANCTFAANQAHNTLAVAPFNGGGAAISNGGGSNGTYKIYNSTFSGNTSDYGGTLAASSGTPTVSLESSILFGNTVTTTGKTDFNGLKINAKNNIIFDVAGSALYTDQGGNLTGAANDPLLGALGNFGGITQVMVPGPFSPAREHGSNPSVPALTTDQRGAGFPRLLTGAVGSKVDIGAVESNDPNPTASATAATVTNASIGSSTYQFSVTFSDDLGIQTSTIINNNTIIRVDGPGFTQLATYDSIDGGGVSTPRTALFHITAPIHNAANFDFSDTGSYTISLVDNPSNPGFSTVSDNDPTIHFVKSGQIGAFNVSIGRVILVSNNFDTGAGSLRQAVADANAFAPSDDTINFSYPLTGGDTIALNSEILITDSVHIIDDAIISGSNTNRIFDLNGPGQIAVTLSHLKLINGLAPDNGGAVFVDNELLTLTNCTFDSNVAPNFGGAVYLNAASATLNATSCVFTNNSAGTGGAIQRDTNGPITLTSCILSGNSATAGAGGAIVVNSGSLTVNSSLIANNSAAGGGGGVSLSSAMAIALFSNTTVSGNNANGNGGGILTAHYGSNLQILNCTVANNTATADGGGVASTNSSAGGVVGGVIITSSIIATNTGLDDLMLPGAGFNTTVVKSLIGTNSAPTALFTLDAGSTAVLGQDPVLGLLANNGNVFVNGVAMQTQGLYPGSPASDSGMDQTPSLGTDQRGGAFSRLVGSGVDMGAFEGVLPAVTGVLQPLGVGYPIITPDPMNPHTVQVQWKGFLPGDAVDNGTIGIDDIIIFKGADTITMDSFVINTPGASPIVTYSYTPPMNSQAGWDNSDNGTYKVQSVFDKVETTAGSPSGVLPNGQQILGSFVAAMLTTYTVDSNLDDNAQTGPFTGDLRYCINSANTDFGPSIINFIAGYGTQTITMTPGAGFAQYAITAAVTINGPASPVTIDAGTTNRIFSFSDITAVGSPLVMSNMRLINGKTVGPVVVTPPSNPSTTGGGGAISVTDDNLSLTNVTISNCTTDQNGGAIEFSVAGGNAFTMNNVTLSNNSVTGAGTGATGNGGAAAFQFGTAVTVTNSTISGNTSSLDGGGFSFYRSGASLQMTNCSVTGNKADNVRMFYGGGGVYFFGAAAAPGIVIDKCTFSGNRSGITTVGASFATSGGGAICLNGATGTFVIKNTTITGNSVVNGSANGGRGGGVLTRYSSGITLQSDTISGNDASGAGAGGGGVNILTSALTAQTFSSTIIAQNTVGGSANTATSDMRSAQVGTVVSGNNNFFGVPNANFSFTGTGNFLTGTAAAPLDAKLAGAGTAAGLALNGAPAGSPLTLALLSGSPAINRGNSGGLLIAENGVNRILGGTADIGAMETAFNSPTVVSAFANGTNNTGGGQNRSMVTKIVVTFSENVTFPNGIAGAFVLTRIANPSAGPESGLATGPAATVGLSASAVGGVVTLTFTNAGAVAIDPAGSLKDGVYQLQVVSLNVLGVNALMAADVLTTNSGDNEIYRLFGDGNGSRSVDVLDFSAFVGSFGTNVAPGFAFDYDGGGTVDTGDFSQFIGRFGTNVP